MTNGTYPDTVYDKDMQTVRIVREFNANGTVVVENGSRKGITLIPSKYSLRRFTGLFDADNSPIYEGDFLRVGMRRGDESGWTTEIVAWQESCNEWALLAVGDKSGVEFMQMQYDQQLRRLTGESVFKLKEVQCPECGEHGHAAANCDNLG